DRVGELASFEDLVVRKNDDGNALIRHTVKRRRKSVDSAMVPLHRVPAQGGDPDAERVVFLSRYDPSTTRFGREEQVTRKGAVPFHHVSGGGARGACRKRNRHVDA